MEDAERGIETAAAQRAQIQAELDRRAQLALTNPGEVFTPSSAVLAQQLSEIEDERAGWQNILDHRTAAYTTGRGFTLRPGSPSLRRSRYTDYTPRTTTPQN